MTDADYERARREHDEDDTARADKRAAAWRRRQAAETRPADRGEETVDEGRLHRLDAFLWNSYLGRTTDR